MQRLAIAIATTIVAISALALTQPLYSASPAQPARQPSVPPGMEVATFAGGCRASPSWNSQFRRSASSPATVDLPVPATPMTTRIGAEVIVTM